MPGMNGRELAQRITEIRPNVKVLYMSGYTENVIGHNGTLDAGIRLLQKPFNLRDLKDKVREVLDATPTPPEVEMSIQSAATQHAARAREVPPTRAQRFQLHLPLRYRRLGEKDWHREKRRTSAAPACCSRQTKCYSPVHNWKLTWCSQRRLPDFQRRKSSAVEKSCALWKDRKARSVQPWPPGFCSITSSMALSPGLRSKPRFCGVRKQKKDVRGWNGCSPIRQTLRS